MTRISISNVFESAAIKKTYAVIFQLSHEMNLCRLLLQCGIEACFYDENHEMRNMGAGLSNEFAINSEGITFSDQSSMHGIAR